MALGDRRCHKIRDTLTPCFKVDNLVSVQPKRIKLGVMTNFKDMFYVMVSIYRLLQKLASVPCAISEWPIVMLQ